MKMSVDCLSSIDPGLFQSVVDCSPAGVAICEAREQQWPVVFVNAAMTQLTGYEASALVGHDLSRLQADDQDQEGLNTIRAALREGSACHALLRNYRSDGTMFWSEVTLTPLRDAQGQVTHFASFHRPRAGRRGGAGETRESPMSTQTMLAHVRDDKLTGLLRRTYFDELVKRDWSVAQRESRRLSLLLFDLDCYAQYKDVFGASGADQSLRRISRAIGGCFRRASDVCGRFDHDQIAVLATGLDLSQAAKLAAAVVSRVRDLGIHHPRSNVSRFVTASAGVVSLVPAHDAAPESLYQAALTALGNAKALGKNRVVSQEPE